MEKIHELEKYFDILVSENSHFSSEHELADDEKRFELYGLLKSKLQKLSDRLAHVPHLLIAEYEAYLSLLDQLKYSFNQLAGMENADLDYCIRAIVVGGIIDQEAYESSNHALAGVIEKMIGLFFDDGDEVAKITKDLMEELKDKKSASFFANKNDDELKKYIMYILAIYAEIEADLINAKAGIIAKDKKMIETLRHLKLGVGKELIGLAVKKTSLISKKKKPLSQNIAKMLDYDGDGVERS
jgi:hypothetical protein